MKLEFRDFGSDISFDGEIKTVLCDSTGQGWRGIYFSDLILGANGCVAIEQRGLHIGLSLRPRGQVFRHGDLDHRFSEDNIAVLQPGAVVAGTWIGEFRSLNLKIAPETIERMSDVALNRTGIETQFVSARSQSAVEYLLRAISVDLEGGCPHGALLVESVAATLIRMFSTPKRESRAVPRLRSSEAALLRDLIASRLSEPLSLSQLAEAAGVSMGHLVRAFKASFGVTPYQYILRARVLYARELIEAGNPSLADVAIRAGFSDLSQMSKTFRRVLDLSPSAVAREARKGRQSLADA
ncbi:MAG: AraC family transcriptional regulator [Methylobacterium sp.]